MVETKASETAAEPEAKASGSAELETALKQLEAFVRELDISFFPPTFHYGPTGSGKTYTAATATKVPELCPVVIITVERTDETLANKPGIDVAQLTVVDPYKYAKAKSTNMWDACRVGIRKVRDLKPFPFKTVILDGLTLLQYHAEERAQDQTPFHGSGDGTGSVLLELTQQGDYRLVKDRIFPLVLDLVDLCATNKAALFITAQERFLTIQPEGDVTIGSQDGDVVRTLKTAPALMPSLIPIVLGQMAIVGKTRVAGTDKWVLETRQSQYREAKDRTGQMPQKLEMPTVAQMVAKLRGGGWTI